VVPKVECVDGPYDGVIVHCEGLPNLIHTVPVVTVANFVEQFLNLTVRQLMAVYHLRTSRDGSLYYEFHEIQEA
jgi:hypothetical protein